MIAIFHHIPKIEELKRNYLFFDELQTSQTFLNKTFEILSNGKLSNLNKENIKDFRREFDWLSENNIISPKEDIERKLIPDIGFFNSKNIESRLSKYGQKPNFELNEHITDFFKSILYLKREYGIDIVGESTHLTIDYRDVNRSQLEKEKVLNQNILSFVNKFSRIYARLASIVLNKHLGDNKYYSLITDLDFIPSSISYNTHHKKSTIVNYVIEKFPVPRGNVSWEKLIEFKNDPNSIRKRFALRNWITTMAKKDFTKSETLEHLNHLLLEYESHYENHKIKYSYSRLQTFIIPTMEIFDNLARVKFSGATKAFFSIGKQNCQLFEDEEKLVGKEVAYIYKANRKFK